MIYLNYSANTLADRAVLTAFIETEQVHIGYSYRNKMGFPFGKPIFHSIGFSGVREQIGVIGKIGTRELNLVRGVGGAFLTLCSVVEV